MTDSEFDEFFRDAYPRLVAFGLAMSTQLHVAQELAQETMIRANEHRHRLGDFDKPYAWCRRVMSNLLIDQHRSWTSEQTAIDRLGRSAVADRTGATSVSSTTETDDAWAAMVAPLTWRQRCIATLYYGDDRSVTDIAEDLGLTSGSVKKTLARIRRKVAHPVRTTADYEEMQSWTTITTAPTTSTPRCGAQPMRRWIRAGGRLIPAMSSRPSELCSCPIAAGSVVLVADEWSQRWPLLPSSRSSEHSCS